MPPIRSFVAIPLPDTIKKSIQDWMESLQKEAPSIRWKKPESLHVTLKFLGTVEEERFEKEFYPGFSRILAAFDPIKLYAKGTGQFPERGKPPLLWVGISGELDPLKQLAQAVGAFFEGHGFPIEKRSFTPHLTIARLKEKPSSGFLKRWQEAKSVSFGDFIADRVLFFKSIPAKTGSVYTVLREFELKKIRQP